MLRFSFLPVRTLIVLVATITIASLRPAAVAAMEPPQSWEIQKSAIVDLPRNHPAASYLPDLVKRLASSQGGGQPVSEAEFLALFDRPESR